ncbi:diguanylate cyclase (GGDEF) domain-containing protein [Saccharomonospora glauca K62]|uniref:Diguanylate cyclase (GGDEF) domain-containing protein n=2 Tax=Saccharomonospora glauca TaxID=40990 RepID=I1D5A6_9PSEU|nr:diguanylate cyclase (GGDEF) domain-containing protein [Saccharomonospora glauca K62]
MPLIPQDRPSPEIVTFDSGRKAVNRPPLPRQPLGDREGTGDRRAKLLPRNWALWTRPRRFVVFLLTMEALSVAGFAVAFVHSPVPGGEDWLRFVILGLGATAHIQLTRRQEERRRNRTKTVLIDLTAVWVFPATLVLPATLAVLLVALIRLQRWFTARRPTHNFVYSSVAHGLAAALANLSYRAMSPQDWSTLTATGSLREFGLVLATAAVYEAVQIVYVGGILALGSPNPTVRTVLGSKADNLLEAITTGLGAVTAVLLVTMPPAVAIMAVVTVVFNRLAEIDQLQNAVVTDPKTGLLNMRGWTESADRALNRVRRAGSTLSVLMVDLDHFKWVNDTYGHPAGDDVLAAVASALSSVTRPADVVGRFGGEEFLLLLPDADTSAAELAAERIRTTIAGLRISTTDKRGARATISGRTASIGVAVFPRHADDLDGLLQAADTAVYEAKEAGRNRVRFAPVPT